MKKIKKACGKGGAGIANLASAAVKTVVNSPLSQPEKQTLRDFRGDDSPPPAGVVVQNIVIHSEPQVVYMTPVVPVQAEPPSYESLLGADAQQFE